jgi:hypothetical protein
MRGLSIGRPYRMKLQKLLAMTKCTRKIVGETFMEAIQLVP